MYKDLYFYQRWPMANFLFKALNSSELLSSCLCHGYLDMYASLWTTWKLMCEGQTSLEASIKKKNR